MKKPRGDFSVLALFDVAPFRAANAGLKPVRQPTDTKPKCAATDFSGEFAAQARHIILEVYLPRVVRCLKKLSGPEIWWRPHPTSNRVGNLALHLEGNVRQWIISGLGDEPDRRQRDREFAERGPISSRALRTRLTQTVARACRILAKLSNRDLARERLIQGFHVTGWKAVFSVTEHFAYHTGQILFATKLLRGEDLAFTHLPGEKRKRPKARTLPAI